MIVWTVRMVALTVLCLAGCAEKTPPLVPAPTPVVKSNPDPREPVNVRLRLRLLAEKARADAKQAEIATGRALAAAAGASHNETEARKSAGSGDKDSRTRAAASAKECAGRAQGFATDVAHSAEGAWQAAAQALSEAQQLGQREDGTPSEVIEANQTAEECRSAATAAAKASAKAAKYAALTERAARNAAEASVLADKPNVQAAPPEVASSSAAPKDEGNPPHPDDVSASGISRKSGLPLLPKVTEPKRSPSSAGQANVAGTPAAIPSTQPAAPGQDKGRGNPHTRTATTQPAEKKRPSRPRVDLDSVPKAPRLPSAQPRPSGIVLANKEASATEACKGRWIQVKGGNVADFLPGGHSVSYLAFRDDGTAEFGRTYAKGTITRKWRIGFAWNPKTGTLTLGSDPKNRPSADSLKGTDIKALDDSVRLSARELPVAFRITRPSKNQIRFAGKTYERQAGQD